MKNKILMSALLLFSFKVGVSSNNEGTDAATKQEASAYRLSLMREIEELQKILADEKKSPEGKEQAKKKVAELVNRLNMPEVGVNITPEALKSLMVDYAKNMSTWQSVVDSTYYKNFYLTVAACSATVLATVYFLNDWLNKGSDDDEDVEMNEDNDE